MTLSILAFISGLLILFWSAEKLIQSTVLTARYYNLPAFLIGMLIIGFGTSAPELMVSVIAAAQGNPGIALGNAYGSNITNTALIVGIAALLRPLNVQASIIKRELPILMGVMFLTAGLLLDFQISRIESILLIVVFAVLIILNIRYSLKQRNSTPTEKALPEPLLYGQLSIQAALLWMVSALILLLISSRILLWGVINIAHFLGLSEFIIGLTIVAFSTSLPELAAAIIAVKKNEHDLLLGNIIGSNLFNTLAVVGLAGMISPVAIEPVIFYRDIVVMNALTVFLFFSCFSTHRPRRIDRYKGGILLFAYLIYVSYLTHTLLS